jgi:hypothetical protein
MKPVNTLRAGSFGHRAFRHLEIHGRSTAVALARALQVDDDELAGLLKFPVGLGLLREHGGHWELGDGKPVGSSLSPAPAAPAPAPASEGVDIDAAHKPRTKAAPAAEPPPAPAPAPAEPDSAQNVDSVPVFVHQRWIDIPPMRQEDGRLSLKQLEALTCTDPPLASANPEPPAPREVVSTAQSVDWGNVSMVSAWCSDGTYQLEKAGTRIELTLDEIVVLREHIAAVLRGIQVEETTA